MKEKAHQILKKFKNINFIKFLVIGATSTIIDYTIYMALSIKINIIISKFISMFCACIFSFFVNKSWTFNNKEKINYLMIITYIISQVINICVNTGINYTMYKITNSKNVAFIFATLIAMIVNYLLQRFIVFKGGKKV